MIIIADSGSTKTEWFVVHQGVAVQRIFTQGTNPFFQTAEEIEHTLAQLLSALENAEIEAIYFYGAGCATPERTEKVRQSIAKMFPTATDIFVASDLLGAARGLCGKQAGIACILGTGSNSCFYDGEKIVQNVSPLGFILGDEGSGAYLGKLMVGNLLKNQWGEELKNAFLARFGLTPIDVLDRTYWQPFPNRFLASLSPFLLEHMERAEVQQLVMESFTAFFQRNVFQYPYTDVSVHFIGSIAYYYRPYLEEAARTLGVRIGTITQSPMDGLIQYHSTL